MADGGHREEPQSGGSSSSPSKRIVEPESLPGGRSSAAAQRVGARRVFSEAEQQALLREYEASQESVAQFAARAGVHYTTLYTWVRRARAGEPVRRRRAKRGERPSFSPEQRRAALEAWSKSGLSATAFSKVWGVSPESLRGWRARYELGGPKALEPKRLGRPRGEGRSQLPDPVQAEIVRTKRRFPSFGLKKVRDFLARFGGTRVSTGSVRKVLALEGLHAVERPARRKKREIVRRFERSKPGELWQTDITSYVLTRSRVRVYLTVFLDDFSRYVVAWSLATHQKSELVCEALMQGIERFGKPEEVLSDQGRQYFAWRGKSDFQRLLVREGIAHVVARTHHPETLGKCERLWETIGTELWERAQPQDLGEARERLAHYFAHYNHFRPHQGIQGLVPADRFFGAEETVRGALEKRMEADELGAALARAPRQGVYVFGQVGDQQLSLHGERGKLVLVTSEGVSKELALDELGLPQKEMIHERVDSTDRERDGARAAETPREEAPGFPAAAAATHFGAGLVGIGEPRGASARALDVRGRALDVARAQESRAGRERPRDTASAGVAAQPGGGLRYARGPLEAAAGARQGAEHGAERGRPACPEEAHRGARGGEPLAAGPRRGPEAAPAHPARTARAREALDEIEVDEVEGGDEDAWEQERDERGTPWS